MQLNGNPRGTDVFKEKLQNNNLVCSDCFSIRKCVYEVSDSWGNAVMKTVEGKNTERAKVESPTAWACAECGPVDERNNRSWREQPIKMGELRDLVDNISETLDEFGIEHDRMRIIRVSEKLKKTPGMSSKDEEILRHATNEGVDSDMESCPKCGKMFLKKRSLRSHHAVVHGDVLPGDEREYGTNWREIRQKILARDGHQCQICGRGDEEIGRSPDIHHITPLREFDKPAEANQEDNLVALCPRHHMMVEYGNLSAPEP